MSELEDVVRWSSAPDAPEGMRELLRAAGGVDEPNAAELASLRARMAPQLAPTPTPGATGAGLGAARAIVAGILAGVCVGIVAYVVSRPGRSVAVAPPEPAHVHPAPPPVQNVAPVQPAIVPPPVEPEPAPPPPRPRHQQVTPSQPPPPPPPAVEPTTPAPPPPPQISEVELLEQARTALRGDHAAQALALTEQHATLYSDGALTEEREALAIEALLKLGRADDARTRWSKFATTYPQSNYHARLQRLIDAARPR